MAKIIPFRAIRPPRDLVHLVATRSYMTYSEPALKDKLENNPYTFLRVINPDWEGEKLYGSEKFEAVRSEFHRFMEEGYFVQDEKPAYYLYEQVVRGRSFMGIIGGAAVDDYAKGMIRKHEDTLSAREAMFKEYLKVTDFNAEPVLLSYPDIPGLDVIVARHRMERPEYEFYTTDGHLHRLWAIDEEEDHHSIEAYFERIPALYIADGHHRCASSALLSEEICSHSPEARENGTCRYFMALMMPESQLHIWDFNRLVRDLNGHSDESFRKAIEEHFQVSRIPQGTDPLPRSKHDFSMYLDGEWYNLIYDGQAVDPTDPVADLDAQILTEKVLTPLLGIEDLRSDERVSFLDGRKGVIGLEASVDSGGFAVAFALHPISMEQLKRISDAGRTMPPKSTYIEPKLRSGLTVYPIEGRNE